MTLPLEAAALTFDVQGVPVPQGSMVSRGRRLVAANKKLLVPWREEVATCARAKALLEGWQQLRGPVRVDVDFWLRRPASATRARPHIPPDLDKLQRAIFDACTDAEVWKDDGQVVTVLARKWYALEGVPGCRITIREVP